MKIAIGCEPSVLEAKNEVKAFLEKQYGMVKDFGGEDPYYMRTAFAVGEAVADGSCDFGVLLCATGVGMTICANKVEGVFAAHLTDVFSTESVRKGLDANVACLGGTTLTEEQREELLHAFFSTVSNTDEFSKSKRKEIAAYEKGGEEGGTAT